MSTPYGIQISENCLLCKLRQSGFFCDLPKASLEELEKVKYANAYPQGAVLFVEGQAPRGVHMICSGRVKLSTLRETARL
jgi:CRP/FNR family cyclic AMP-dependent transcriptional regulator